MPGDGRLVPLGRLRGSIGGRILLVATLGNRQGGGGPHFREAEPEGRQPLPHTRTESWGAWCRVVPMPSRDRHTRGGLQSSDAPRIATQRTARSGRKLLESGGRNEQIAGHGLWSRSGRARRAAARRSVSALSREACLQEISPQLMGRGEISTGGEPDEEQRSQCCGRSEGKDDHHLVLDRQQGRRTCEDLTRHHPR